jgi:type IV secretion system protein VirB5
MAAVHKNTVYKPLPIPNPFHDGQDRAYADILADKMKETKIWRLSALSNGLLFFFSLILFLASTCQQKTVPVLVNVMPSGESQYLGEVRQGAVQVPEASVHYEIRKFVSNLRSVSTDYQVVFNNIEECFFMVTSDYQPILRRVILENSPFALVGRVRRSVEIESVLNVTGHSYQVNWTETAADSSSAPKISKMRAVATVRLITPSSDTIKRNPLGIYIENFEMTEL